MKSKPDKYGMKIFMLNDYRTAHMINSLAYVGNNYPIPSYYVRITPELCMQLRFDGTLFFNRMEDLSEFVCGLTLTCSSSPIINQR